LKAAFERAIEWEMLESNLFKRLKFRKTQKAKPTFMLRKDLDLLLANAKNPDIMDMMVFSINTGCRLSEVVWLRWANISFEDNEITLGDAQFETKSRKQRIIPISAEVRQMLAERKAKAKSEYVFSKENGFPYSKEYVSKCFKAVCRKTGLGEEFHFHCLRHSFASILAMKGTPTFVIKELMGHSSINTTEIYAHVNKESLHNAITALN
jgi:site-specific recombinase XerD